MSTPENSLEPGTIFGFPKYPRFELGKTRFPQNTYFGRLLHCFEMTDPKTMFTTEEELHDSRKLLEDFKNGHLPPNVTNRQLWHAQKIKDSSLNQDTGVKNFVPFRMSGYLVLGAPMAAGTLIPAPYMLHSIFWQWLYQIETACVTYANANGTRPIGAMNVAQGLYGSITLGCLVSFGLIQQLNRAKTMKPMPKFLIERFAPFTAVSLMHIIITPLMRYHEYSGVAGGVAVMNSNGEVIGNSKKAGIRGVELTTISRIAMSVPVFLFTPLLMSSFEKMKFLARNARLKLPITASLCMAMHMVAVPASMALFPQMSRIAVKNIEPHLQELTTEKYVYFNKGL